MPPHAEVVLAGFAMGTGEVTRYLAVHGPARIRAAVLVAPAGASSALPWSTA